MSFPICSESGTADPTLCAWEKGLDHDSLTYRQGGSMYVLFMDPSIGVPRQDHTRRDVGSGDWEAVVGGLGAA